MSQYLKIVSPKKMPRIPIEGYLDITYRCNNNCRHCWLRISPDDSLKANEITFPEIRKYFQDAKSLGCTRWYISGGEPMLRQDFVEIFDFISSHASHYSLNTNGTLITPEIAGLMKRPGNKWISLYGATAEVNDHVTRTPGSFAAAIRGMSYLKEAGAKFVVQLVPMRDNLHQYREMIKLAESLSLYWRIGAPWFYLSASGDEERNREIRVQRLDPKVVLELNGTDVSAGDHQCEEGGSPGDNCFSLCIAHGQSFHIDPFGQMSFCSFVKDVALRYDLRRGSVDDCWDNFLPELGRWKMEGAENWQSTECRLCADKKMCGWCEVHSYLEHGSYGNKVEYLCELVEEKNKFRKKWEKNNRRFFRIGGLTIQVDSDLPFPQNAFAPRLDDFITDEPGQDIILHHHFSLPETEPSGFGRLIYEKPPYAIYRKDNSWIYTAIPEAPGTDIYQVIVFNHEHSRARIYNQDSGFFDRGELTAISLMPTDQQFLARVFAHRNACWLHSAGIDYNGNGFLFVGHSGAGKSTIVKMMKEHARILCDDRNIVRKHPEGFFVHGTWGHGEVPLVSCASAPLKAVFLIQQSDSTAIEEEKDKKKVLSILLACLIKPFLTREWWTLTLDFLEDLIQNVQTYRLRFNTSGDVVEVLNGLGGSGEKKFAWRKE